MSGEDTYIALWGALDLKDAKNASLQQQLSDCESSLRVVEADIATKDRAIADLTKQLYEADKSDMSARDLLNDLEAELEAAEAREKQVRAAMVRLIKIADSGHYRDGTHLSIAAHPAFDDARALASKEGGK